MCVNREKGWCSSEILSTILHYALTYLCQVSQGAFFSKNFSLCLTMPEKSSRTTPAVNLDSEASKVL